MEWKILQPTPAAQVQPTAESGTGGGAWRAEANLTAAGVYTVTVRVLGEQRCVAAWYEADAAEVDCVPDVEVVPGRSLASVSLLTGAGVNDLTAGAHALLRVVPLDRWGNRADWVHASIDLSYQLTASMVNGSVVVGPTALQYSTWDDAHEVRRSPRRPSPSRTG